MSATATPASRRVVPSVAYVYPWDVVGDPAAPGRIARLGTGAVALAATYHSVRAATPYHPNHRVVEASHAASYVRRREAAWGRRLSPGVPDWVPGPDSFGAARDALRGEGTAVHAWLILAHDTRLGQENPDLTARDAFGTPYPYALCPSNRQVADYLVTLARETVSMAEADGVILEAAGLLGFAHNGRHEKTEGAEYSPAAQQLLSICCCPACRRAYREAGVDADRLTVDIRAALAPGNHVESVEAALGESADLLRAVRTGIAAKLQSDVVAGIRDVAGDVRVALHGNLDPWATGAFATIAGGVDPQVDAVVINVWSEDIDDNVRRLERLRDSVDDRVSVGAYVLVLPPQRAEVGPALAVTDRYRAAGVDELHLYHAGMASPRRLALLRELATDRAAWS